MMPGKVIYGLLVCAIGLARLSDGFQCSTCVRDGTCETIRGILSMTVMSKGYNPVVTIPRGACNINVTEAAESSNNLALKETDYSYVFNGHWYINDPGPYVAAGTRFTYVRREPGCPGECVYAEGPLLQNVTVQLLYHDRSPGIFYTFQVPIHLKNEQSRQYPLPSASETRRENSRSELRERPSEIRQEDTYAQEQLTRQETTTPPASFPEMSPFPDASYIRRKGPIFTSDFSHIRQRNRNNNRKEMTGHRQYPSSLGERRALTGVTYSRGIEDNVVSVEEKNPLGDVSEAFDLTNELVEDTDDSVDDDESSDFDHYDYILKSDKDADPLVNAAEQYSWRPTGLTECSRICGGGVQQTMYECVQSATNQTVNESDCQHVLKPEIEHSVCNAEACTPSWEAGSWGICSVTCGRGYQSRNVTCQQRISAASSLQMEDRFCASEKPVDSKRCYQSDCYTWQIGNWGDCDVQCGPGSKTRRVTCQDETGNDVADDKCDGSKPRTAGSCDGGSCVRSWHFTKWTDQCSADCGEGHVSRTVRCLSSSGRVLTDEQCEVADKPPSSRRCQIGVTCGGKWFTGPWSQCSQSCGQGIRTRHVLCMKTMGDNLVMTPEHNCLSEDKPSMSDTCTKASCGNMWYMTNWSQCSKTCGGGVRTRTVQCYDDQQRPASQCDVEERPNTSQSCNTDTCREVPQSQPAIHRRCSDKYPNCQIVVQARLCRYHYYQRKCCDSCSNNVYSKLARAG